MKRSIRNTLIFFSLLTATIVVGLFLLRPPAAEKDAYWEQADNNSLQIISHELWQQTLDDYLITEHISGINRVDYEALKDDGAEELNQYLSRLAEIDPRSFTHVEQFAYWVNLYNALTVKLIADSYPINSITKLGNSPIAFGPWDDEIITVAGKALTLNDIEHRILRPIWEDYRIHFAVNCASLGCPNLLAEAFTADNQERLLEQAAKDYLTHPRGLSLEGSTLYLSSIFDWYKNDFGNTQNERLETLSRHLPEPLASQVKDHSGAIEYRYDWQLNAD